MPWDERIREAAYTSPESNTRTVFDFENVRQAIDKQGSAFNFADANGTFIQSMGHSGRRFPLRMFFWGDDYDLEIAAFEETLLETGDGKLEHPVYGVKTVVPFGTITRRDDLKTAANQGIIEVTFWETIGLVYPTAQGDPASSVLTAVSEYNDAQAAEFEEVTNLDSAVEHASFKNNYQALLDQTSSSLQTVADVQSDVSQQFNAIVDSINNGLDILVQDPLTLAFQTTLMIEAPARALAAIGARLDAFSTLASSITSGDGAVATPGNNNEFRTNDLFASTYVAGSIISVVNNEFLTRPDAISAAEEVLLQFEAVNSWRDANLVSLLEIDTGGAYQQLQEAVALAAGFLVEISFTLKQERRLVLDRARTVIDLVAELYGSIDDQLDFFINSNDLSGSEILEIPRGREIVYYI